ncbi:MAG TPA: NUDIX domain-containing protein [Gemmatimonadaceae bacterium]|nr:NUDIX domain-containing protein [Gemmatimonadaceae bacterium]
MREPRSARPARAVRRVTVSVDVVLLAMHGPQLAVLLRRRTDSTMREGWELPWEMLRQADTLTTAAARVARTALGARPALLEQVAAFGERRRHPGKAELSVAYLALADVLPAAPAYGITTWAPVRGLPALPPAQRGIVQAALAAARDRLDRSPVAFRLLPPAFTLSELQAVYEVLLGRQLHKASFRRALRAAGLVEPTSEWRSEGRGRPAQLYRYAPRAHRGPRRGVRLEGLSR